MTHSPSFGSQLKWDPAGGTAYSPVGQVRDMGFPDLSRGDIDVTDHDDGITGGTPYRQFLPGIADGGNLTFAIGFDPSDADHGTAVGTGLLGSFEQDGCTLPAWELTLHVCTGTAIWTFDGYPNSFSGAIPLEGELTADVGVKVSGKPTLTIT